LNFEIFEILRIFFGDSQIKFNLIKLIYSSTPISLYEINPLWNYLWQINTAFFLIQKYQFPHNNRRKTHEYYLSLLYSFCFSSNLHWNIPHIFHKSQLSKNKVPPINIFSTQIKSLLFTRNIFNGHHYYFDSQHIHSILFLLKFVSNYFAILLFFPYFAPSKYYFLVSTFFLTIFCV
jgi:hypothetical protein